MASRDDLVGELADRLTAIGFDRRGSSLSFSDGPEACCVVGRWKKRRGATKDIRVYSGLYFGSEMLWVGFGSSKKSDIDELMLGYGEAEFTTITSDDWRQDLMLEPSLRSRLIETDGVAREDYTPAGGEVFFGLYIDPFDEFPARATEFITRVVDSVDPAYLELERATKWLGATEGKATAAHRKGQQRFRSDLQRYWRGRCAVTNCRIQAVLRASHIAPWSSNKAATDRINSANGILLTATLDALFDRGLIAFADNGTVLVSKIIDVEDRSRLGLDQERKPSRTPFQ